nr:AsmA family protein [Chelativorans sp.]
MGSLLILVLTAALVAPYFIDWTSYRASFEREAGRILGREVRVGGTARARLLPFPSVTFTDVVVAGAEPGDPAMTVDEFSMDAELAPFLSGELLIFDMRLVRPSMNINIAPNGRIDWAVRPSSPFDPRQVTLERVSIVDGTIRVHQQASGRVVTLADIDSEVSARSLSGPWRVAGDLEIDGIPVAVTASTGSVDQEGVLRLRVAAQPRDYPIIVETDGSSRFVEGEGIYSGTFRVSSARPAERADAEGDADTNSPQPGPADPGNRVIGRFTLDHQRLAVEEFRFETGPESNPYTASGKAAVELGANPSFSVTAEGAQIRLEGPEAESGVMSGLSADARLSALMAFLANLPKQTIPGTVAINLPAIVAGDTTIRDIRVRAEPSEEGWNIGSMAATLPGRTRFEGEGVLATGDALAFTGKMLLAIAQPSGFAAWLARDVDEAIRRLPAAGFSADVELTRERQRFDNLELILGDARFRGSIDRQSPPDARPSLALTLDGDRLDLEGMQAFASLFIDDAGRNRLADHDVDLDVAAGPVVAQGLTAERLDTALRLRAGTLEIDRLTVTGLAGANISATGTVSGIGAAPTGNLDASVVAVDLAPLIGLLARRLPENRLLQALDRNASAYPGLLSDSQIEIVANTAEGSATNELSVTAQGTAGGTDFNFSLSSGGTLADLSTAPLETHFTARNEEPAALYALVGLPAVPLALAPPAEAELSASGRVADGLETRFRFSGDGMAASFEGKLSSGAAGMSAAGNARLESSDLEPWLAAAGISLPGFGYGLPVQLSAEVDHGGEGLTVLSNIAGKVAGSTVSGDLNAELRESLPHLTGSLALGGLDLGLAAEMVAGSDAFQTDGGVWPRAPFRESGKAPISADVELSSDRLWFGDAATVEEARLRLKLDPSGLALSELTGRMMGGAVEGLAEFRNDAGTGLFSAQVSLRNAPLGTLLPGSGLAGAADVSAGVTASGKSVEAMAAALSGSGSASLRAIEISGLDPAALGPIIAEADKLGVDINAEKVAAFAPPLLRGGRFEAGDAQLAFTIANGVARVPPVQMQSQGARMSVEAMADLRDRTVSASGSITYDPGLEAVEGSEPTVRFSAEGRLGEAPLQLDTEPLAQFLTQRALEREQARVEHMQALLLERQRLRREANYFRGLEEKRAAEEAERIRLAREAERIRAEEERRRLEEEERQRLQAEEERRRLQEQEERRRAQEEESRRAQEEAAQRAQEEAERRAQEDAARRAREEEARRARESAPPPVIPPAQSAPAPAQTMPAPGEERFPGLPGVNLDAPQLPQPDGGAEGLLGSPSTAPALDADGLSIERLLEQF